LRRRHSSAICSPRSIRWFNRFISRRNTGGGARLELPWPELASYPGFGLVRSRLDFDETLARNAQKAGVRLVEGMGVTGPVIDDRTAGIYARRERIRPVDHRGDFYRVAGPLNMPRCPQGRPVLVQAGSSEDGKALAAGSCDVKAFFVRKQAKGHGLQRRIEGPALDPAERCMVVEDVVTTGGSTLAAIAALHEEGHTICGVLSVLDRLVGYSLSPAFHFAWIFDACFILGR